MLCSIRDTQIIRVWVELLNAVRTDFSVTCDESRKASWRREAKYIPGKRIIAYAVDQRVGAMGAAQQ